MEEPRGGRVIEDLKAVALEVRPLFYSCKLPTVYQVRLANILPPPSALLGSLYKAYATYTGLDFEQGYARFLESVVYAGFALLPRSAAPIAVCRFQLLLKHHEFRGGEGHRSDAMLRGFVFTDGLLVALLLTTLPQADYEKLKESAALIEYLSNSESLVHARLLECSLRGFDAQRDADGYVAQIVASEASKFPLVGIVEQCGVMPEEAGGSREPHEVIYVWQPLKPIQGKRDFYEPVRACDINLGVYRRVLTVELGERRSKLIAVVDYFESIKASVKRSKRSSGLR